MSRNLARLEYPEAECSGSLISGQRPIILFGALFIAFSLNSLSILCFDFRNDKPSVVSVRLSLRLLNLAVIGSALVLLGVLLSYEFVETFQVRPLS